MPARPLPCAGGVSITSPVGQVFSVIVSPLYIFNAGVQYSDSIVKAVVARLVVALLIYK